MGNLTCCDCGVLFGVPDHWERSRREDKKTFYCPNGHGQSFIKGTADRLAEELSRERQRAAQLEDEVRWQKGRVEEWKRSAAAQKGIATKLSKRAAHGVCPCCSRTFSNMARHMKTKHPDFNVVPFKAEAV